MELTVSLLEPAKRGELFGVGDRHLRRLRDELGVKLQTRNATVKVIGETAAVAKAVAALERLQEGLKSGGTVADDDLDRVLMEVQGRDARAAADGLRVFSREGVEPRTPGQREYVRAMLSNDLVVCVGPAGSGKTYLAVAVAVHLLKSGQTRRIALVRPAVEAGERLGFLPGDMQQKVNPYLRPLFDAMHDMMTFDQLKRFMINDIVEVIPLAYMRGRTFNHSVIILDEAQNTTPAQMLMFLTRLGQHSRMIVTGDDSQVDLEPGQPSGLIDAVRRLRGLDNVAVMRLSRGDIVRHRLVTQVIHRYESPPRRGDSAADSDFPETALDGATDATS